MPTGVYIRNKNYRDKMSMLKKGHIVSVRTRKKIGDANKTKMKGKRNSPKTEFKKGNIPSNPFKKGNNAWNKGLKGFRAGKSNNNWKGGITPFLRQLRTSFEYRQWRSDIFTRDNFTCLMCGKHGGKLHADHIKMFSLILRENNIKTYKEAIECEELWNINNGQSLCLDCHNKKTKIDLKRSWGFRKSSVGELPKEK